MVDGQRDRDAIASEAIGIASADDRDAYIARACGEDPELERRVRERVAERLGAPGAVGDGEPGRIGPYRILERVGQGDADVVFKAEEDGDDDLIVSTTPAARGGGVSRDAGRGTAHRAVALALIREGLDWRKALARFEGEWPELSRLEHPNIARVLGAGTRPSGQPYLVSAWVDGVPITRHCDDHRLPVRRRLELFAAACDAVRFAHQKGVIHGNLRPSNVLVAGRDGEPSPKVVGFGLSGAIRRPPGGPATAGPVIEPEYLSPELADRGAEAPDVDARSDVYALGAILYELLTGTPPLPRRRLEEASPTEALRMVREETPPPPSERLGESKEALESAAARRDAKPSALLKAVRGDLDCLVMKALEKDRARRYESVGDLARDVRRHLDREPLEACPAGPWRRLRGGIRKHRLAAMLAGAALLLMLVAAVGGTGLAIWAHSGEAHAREAQKKAEDSRTKAEKSAEEYEGLLKQAEAARKAVTEERDRARADAAAANRSDEESKAVLAFLTRKMLSAGRPGDGSLPAAFWASGQGKDVSLRKAAEFAETQVARAFDDRPLAEAQVREILGLTFLDLGDAAEAVKQYERALALREALQGPTQAETAACRNQLAVAYRLAGRADAAGRLFDRKTDSPSHAAALAVRGSTLLIEKRPIDAELMFRECLAIRRKIRPDDWATFETMSMLGEALLDQKKFADAEPLLKSGFEGMQQHQGAIPPDDRPRLAKAAERLVRLYEDWDKKAQAAEWRTRVEKAREQERPAGS